MMKTVNLTLAVIVFVIATSFAQSPQSFKYQAVARDIAGDVLANQNISLQISIIQTSPVGSVAYSEIHNTTTNQFGLFGLEIGTGIVVSGVFSTIDWGADIYFVQIEMDETGGTSYLLMGTSQLLSVPYALYAEKAGNVNDADSTNELQTLSLIGNDLTISNGNTVTITDNVNDADADSTNELQAISISNDTIFLSNGGFVVLPTDQVDDADSDPANELQAISISNDTIYLVNGGFVVLPPDQTDDADADPANELQAISISNDTIYLSNGGFVVLPADQYVTNTDLHDHLGGDGATIQHSSLGAVSANQHHTPPASLPPSGIAGGDLFGAYPNPSVINDSHTHNNSTVSDILTIASASTITLNTVANNAEGGLSWNATNDRLRGGTGGSMVEFYSGTHTTDTYVTNKDAHDHLGGDGAQIQHSSLGGVSANQHHTPPASLPPSGTAGGDLSGTYPNPSVVNDSHTHTDGTMSNTLTVGNASTITLNTAANNAEGGLSWNATNNRLRGGTGVSMVEYYSGAHTTDTYVTNKDAHDHLGGDGATIQHSSLGGITASQHHTATVNTNLTEATVETYIANDVATNYVPRDNGTKLVTGTIYDDGTDVGIGVTAPIAKLDVNGSLNVRSALDLWSASFNEVKGRMQGINGGSGLGRLVFYTRTAGTLTEKMRIDENGNVGIGMTNPNNKIQVADLINFGTLSTSIGYQTSSAAYSTAIGYQAGFSNSLQWNTFLGYRAGYSSNGSVTLALGNLAGYNNTGGYNFFIGYQAGYSHTSGMQNTMIGHYTGYSNVTGVGNVFIGFQAGYQETGSRKLYISNSNTTSPLIYGDFVAGWIGIRTSSPQGALDVKSTTGGLVVPRMTTTQRNAMTAVNGTIIYNTTANQFNFYENGGWVLK